MKKILTILIVALLLCSLAGADMIMYGLTDNSSATNGAIFARDEFAPGTVVPGSDIGWIGMGGTVCLAELSGGTKYAVGMGHGYIMVRDAFDNTWTGTTNYTNLTGLNTPVLSAVSRNDGHVLYGTANNEYMGIYRDYTNVVTNPPGVTGGAVNAFGSPVTAVAVLPNGLSLLAHENGAVLVRNPDDLTTQAMIGGNPAPVIYWGTKVNDMAVDPSGNVVFALESGLAITRHWSDLNTNVGAPANYGGAMPVREVEMLSNGNVAMGFGNGYVDIRSATDLVTSLGLGGQFTGGTPITALEATSNDNIIIAGYSNGTVWTKSGIDMSTVAPILTWGQEVTSIAAVVPEPATIALLSMGALAMLRKRK